GPIPPVQTKTYSQAAAKPSSPPRRTRIDIFAARRRPGFGGRLQVDDHPTLGRAPGDRFAQFNLAVPEVVGGDVAENVRGHHAHRRPPEHLFGKRASPVAEHDLVLALVDDKEITLDPAL